MIHMIQELFGQTLRRHPTTQIVLATLAPYSGERNFYEICRALPLTHAPTEWRPTHAPSTSGSDPPEAGAPENIPVTSEMIEAGIEALAIFDLHDPASWKVPCIYRAMEAARRNFLDREAAGVGHVCLSASVR